MQQTCAAARGQPYHPAVLPLLLGFLATGCASTSASQYPSRFELGDVKCHPSESSAECCIKTFPGQYERCGLPRPPEPGPNYLPPLGGGSQAAPLPRLPTQEEREEWDRDICRPRYEKCMETGGRHDGRVYGESQCRACFSACMRYGYWPLRANEKPCPGA
jgi:hypothetical protein